MVQTLKLLQQLAALDIHPYQDGDKLKVRDPHQRLTDALRQQIKAQKAALLDRLAARAQPTVAAIYPLTPLQAGMWFHSQLAPNRGAYIEQTLWHVQDAAFDPAALIAASEQVIHQYESLRAAIRQADNGEPRQVIYSAVTLPIQIIDWHTLSDQEHQQRLAQLLSAEGRRNFDFTQAPLLRLTIVEGAQQRYDLLLTFHHILLDRWSVALFWTAVWQAYRGLPLPQAAPYHTYVHYVRQQPVDGAFWQDYLRGFSAPTPLPALLPQRQEKGQIAMVRQPLPLTATQQLITFARQQGVTLNTLCQAAWALLLARYSGETDVVFGMVTSGRTAPIPAIETMIGLLINTLPFRVQLTAATTTQALVAQVAQTHWTLQPHEHTPLLDLQRWSEVPAGVKLFETLFLFQNTPPMSAQSSSGLTLHPGWGEPGDAGYPLTALVIPGATDEPITFVICYNTADYDAATITRLLTHWQQLLKGMMAQPTQPVLHLPLLTAAEYHQIVHEWNDIAIDFGPPQTIHALFEQQVARTPEAIALSYESRVTNYDYATFTEESFVTRSSKLVTRLTYADLNARANQLAHHLIALGVQADTLVAVAMERSIEMVVSLLAVLKAGGAYVPIDPTYPAERIRYMLADSAAPILLTQAHLPLIQETAQYTKHVILVDTLDGQLAGHPISNPQTATTPADLVYVIYTSGSTGQPKGVMVQHANVIAMLAGFEHIAPKGEHLIGTAVCPFSFDVSVWEIFSVLCFGGSLHLLTAAIFADPVCFADYLVTHCVTNCYIPPALLPGIVEAFEQMRRPVSLERLLVGVEPIQQGVLQRFRNLSANLYIVNGYGPTESTICATFFCFGQTVEPERRTPIGKAVAGYQVYLLNEFQQPVPIGVSGELYVGGAGLARGYLNRSDLTAERFINHPEFGRLYKTGDLCRWLPDGDPSTGSGHCIEFLGRMDFQVKIRGFRIELGEIENQLRAQEAVCEAVVLAREDTPGDKRLVAYIVGEADAAGLRQVLAQRLPEYMVPSAIVTLAALPLTPNGKLDRSALPAPDYAAGQSAFVAPRTAMEVQVAAIWQEVLGSTQVGVYDNFFALGGHSLLATQIITRVRQQLHLDVPLKTLFEAAQLGDFVQRINQHHADQQAAVAAHIPRLAREEEPPYAFPLSFAQQRLWFLDQLEPESAFYNIPILFRLTGPLDVAALEQSLDYLITRHESLRTIFTTGADGSTMQVIQPAASFSLLVIPVAGEVEAQQHAQAEAVTPFNLGSGPLLRVQLLQIAADDHLLALTMHHIIADGWSLGVLMREVSHAYRAFVQGTSPTLPALPLQYADYACWQRAYLSGERLAEQLAYWQGHLRGAPTLLDLPTDRPRPPVQSYRGAHYPFHLNADLTDQLQALAQTHNATLFMVLLAAFQVLLARYSRQTDILVGTPIANRTHAELEGLIGFLVNTLVLRTQLDDNPGFVELLARVRHSTLAAYDHQALPFEQLVEALQPERSLSYSPLFQVMLTWQEDTGERFDLPHLTVTRDTPTVTVAKFDLTLNLFTQGEELGGVVEYSTTLFDEATIARLVGHLEVLLRGIIAQPTQPVLDLPLLTAAEEYQILHEWNDTAVDFGPPQTIHSLFEQQTALTPDAVAVVFDKMTSACPEPGAGWQGDRVNEASHLTLSPCHPVTLSYQELNARANQLAHHLIALGVEADTLVAVMMERSIEMVISLLAVLKAGGAYVPIDPTYPAERIGAMLADAQIRIAIIQNHDHAICQVVAGKIAQLITLDQTQSALAVQSMENPLSSTDAQNLAYLLYTSGSTGTPKGVMIEHRSLVNYVHGVIQRFAFKPGATFALAQSLQFDLGLTMLYPALVTGGCLHILHALTARDPHAFAQYLQTQRIDYLKITPSHLFALTDAVLAIQCAVILGGEAADPQRLAQLQQANPHLQFFNHFGPTETTIGVVTHPINPVLSYRSIPIGQALPNTVTLVLSDQHQPVPLGVAGELYIGGVQVARGYLNQPALTAERFIHHPRFGRLYKTGDLCRWLPVPNGLPTLDYVGRTDFQVKIRGFRIELGEIESVLLAQAAVHAAVVVARTDPPGREKRLVAYVVPAATLSPAAYPLLPATLRSALQAKLPEYMLPAVFVILESLPLTPNGKLDRHALPAPDYTEQQQAYVAPRTELEHTVAGIWADVLGVAQVGVHDNFFALGGHSLLATQVIGRVRRQLQCEVPLKALFEAAQLGDFVQRISHHQANPRATTAAPPIPRLARVRQPPYHFPLSFAQQRLWFLDQLEPNRALYNMSTLLRLEGALMVTALEQGLGWLIERHESLRTTFAEVAGAAVQVIQAPSSFSLSLQPVADANAAHAFARAEAATPFDLPRGPLLRVHLLQEEEQVYWLVLTLHHIISDGWSMRVLAQELIQAYGAFSQGQRPSLPPLTIQYADYTFWQRADLSGERLAAELAFWRSQLAGAPALLALPTNRPRPPVQNYEGAHYAFTLAADLTSQLKQMAHAQGATLFMLLLAAFQVLLARYSRQTDIVVGTPIANRTHAELERLIGFLVNTLALRTRLDDNPSFVELLARVRQTTLAAYDHQELPFEQLVETLQPERSLSYSPLFQVVLTWQEDAGERFDFPHLTVTRQALPTPVAKFDLTLHLFAQEKGLGGVVEYSTALFDETTIARLVGHLAVLLKGILAQPEQPVLTLPLLTAAEEHQIVHEWNDTAVDFGPPQTIHALFEQQVALTPEAIALSYESRVTNYDHVTSTEESFVTRNSKLITRLTYADLNARANQLAHHLIALGVQADTLVAVAMERSIEMVVSLLAVLKAGGAYVPIDPTYPAERIRFMLADSAAPLMLTQAHLSVEHESGEVIDVDQMQTQLATYPTANPTPATTPAHLAYVIYTSGSTGQPKGVMIQHDQVYNLVRWHQHAFAIAAQDRASQMANPAFDATGWEIFPYLTTGATLFLTPEAHRLSPPDLAKWLNRHAITAAFVPTPIANALLAQEIPLGVTWLLTGGDRLLHYPPPTAGFTLVNNYGPTENTVVTTSGIIRTADKAVSPPIGKAIANVQVYLLNEALQPVPLGVPGELYIGGVQVARGYLNRPELTAERFIYHPRFGRVYKTGDLCRWLPDGAIEFLGRLDNQVKLRGFRIELGEIESVLLAQAGMREAVVLAREETLGAGAFGVRLVAYVVGEAADETLRQALAQRLPDYMIPTAFVWLAALPLTPNGKLDRHALPAPDYAAQQSVFVAPRTTLEAQVAAIWCEVLGLAQVGVHDNFFALGGHSLLATQVIGRIRHQLQCEVPLKMLFEAAQLGDFAQRIEQQQQADQPVAAVARRLPRLARARAAPHAFPLSFAQQRLWFLDQLEPNRALYNIVTLLRLEGPLVVPALEQSLGWVVKRHESLRTTFAEVAGAAVQVIQAPFSFSLSLQRVADANAAQAFARAEAATPFDLQGGPLLRAHLLEENTQVHWLVLTLHHIISDGWSMQVLAQELSHAYRAFCQGQSPSLPPLTIQYADYALWQRADLSGERLAAELAFWRTQLAGAPARLDLPTDRPRPPVQNYEGAHYAFTLAADLASQLKQMAHAHGATLFMLLLAAFQVLLARYSRQTDIVVGTPIANRTHAELEGLIGFLVNTLALRTQLDDNPSFLALLARVRHSTLAAYDHQALPFEQLVETLQPERSLSYSPLFQVMLTWQEDAGERFDLPHLTVTRQALPTPVAKFDLTLHLFAQEKGLGGVIEYSTALFDETTIARLVGHLEVLLRGIIAQPEQPVLDLPLLTAAEYQQIIHDWNDTAVDFGPPQTIHSLFEQQAALTPDAVAVVFDKMTSACPEPGAGWQGDRVNEASHLTLSPCHPVTLSYQELNARANQLARYLLALGVGPETLVGLCVERSLEMLVGMLAILKAGGAYVPLDISYPADRLAFMVDDTAISLLLTQEKLVASFPTQLRIITLDALPKVVAQQSTDNLKARVTPDTLAYLMYTSGSTGRPKGVCVTHRNVVSLVKATTFAQLTAAEVFLQLAPLAFDASTFEIWGALLNGAQLVVMPPQQPSLAEVGQAIRRHQVTTLWLTAGLFQLMVDERIDDLRSLRQLLAGGDVLSVAHVQKVLAHLPTCRLINGYGPTENTTFTCCYPVVEAGALGASVPIGRPIANTQVYILSETLQPTPIGVAGELYAGGAGVARGYHQRPELTAARFICNPFGAGRLYKTGDLCRWLPDGNIEFLGRLDNQIKLRGFRIELGEIESVLLAQEAVREAVVLTQEETPGTGAFGARLVAYVVGEAAEETLRQVLAQRLPDYMIPAAFVWLDALPLTPNGKLDRHALPAPIMAHSTVRVHRPRTALEQQMVALWEQVLGINPIGIHDNFFALGGHSLLAVQLMAKLQPLVQQQLPLRTLFTAPTVAQLAAQVAQANHGAASTGFKTSVVALQPRGTAAPLTCLSGAGGSPLYLHALAQAMGGERPIYALEPRGLDGKTPPFTTVEAVAAYQIAHLQRQQPAGPYHLAGHSFGGLVAYEMAQQLHKAGACVGAVILLDTSAPTGEAALVEEIDLVLLYERRLREEQGLAPVLDRAQLQPLTPEERLVCLKQSLETAGILPSNSPLTQIRGLIQVAAADMQAAGSYLPSDFVRLPLHLFVAMDAGRDAEATQTLIDGWAAYGEVTVHEAPGTHTTMMYAPQVVVLAAQLQECLKAIEKETVC